MTDWRYLYEREISELIENLDRISIMKVINSIYIAQFVYLFVFATIIDYSDNEEHLLLSFFFLSYIVDKCLWFEEQLHYTNDSKIYFSCILSLTRIYFPVCNQELYVYTPTPTFGSPIFELFAEVVVGYDLQVFIHISSSV